MCIKIVGICLTITLFALQNKFINCILHGKQVPVEGGKFMVSIRYAPYEIFMYGGGHFCGGALIAPDYVLTAANCMFTDKIYECRSRIPTFLLKVVMGDNDLMNEEDNLKFRVQKRWIHEKYNKETKANDIAMLQLVYKAPPIVFSITTISIGIARPTINCKIMGWGQNYRKEEDLSKDLLYGVNGVPKPSYCEKKYNNSLHPGQFCAWLSPMSRYPCVGDTGGPLVCNDKLVGILSSGETCGKLNEPVLYTNASYYEFWIENITPIHTDTRMTNQACKYHYSVIHLVIIIGILFS